MEEKNVRDKAIGGFFWTLAEKFLAQFVSFVVSLILARLLMPEDYGIVAIVSVFTSILGVLVKSGLGAALIQKKDSDSVDFSTVFYFNLFFSVVLYCLMFLISPWIADYYHNSQLIGVLRIASIGLIVNGVNNVQQAYVSRNLLFKKFFWSTLFGTFFSAVVGILMAFMGYGVWALVTQQLLNSVIDTIFLHCTIGWKPTKQFSFERFKNLYGFGWKLLISDFATSLYNNAQALVIGKKYSADNLAYYNKGNTFPQLIVRNLDNSIQAVTFPVLSKRQNDFTRFKQLMYRGCTLSFFFVCPMMIGMISVAEPLVKLLLTEKWLPCVPYLKLYCITYLLRPIEATNLQAIYAMGRSDLTLKMDIIKKVYGLLGLIVAVMIFDNPIAICVSLVVCTFVNTFLNMIVVERLVQYRLINQIASIVPTLFCSIVMWIICVIIEKICYGQIGDLALMVVQIVAGSLSYLVLSWLLRVDALKYLLSYISIKLKFGGFQK